MKEASLIALSMVFYIAGEIGLISEATITVAGLLMMAALIIFVIQSAAKQANPLFSMACDIRYNLVLLMTALYLMSFLVLLYGDPDKNDFAIYKYSLFVKLIERIPKIILPCVCALSLFSLSCGWLLGRKPLEKPVLKIRAWQGRRLIAIFSLLYVVSVLLRMYAYSKGRTTFGSDVEMSDIFGPLSAAASILTVMAYSVPAIVYMVGNSIKSRTAMILVLVMLASEAINALAFGIKSGFVLPVAYLLFAYVYVNGRFPPLGRLMIGVLGAVMIIQGAVTSRHVYLEKGVVGLELVEEVVNELLFITDDDSRAGVEYYAARINVAIPLLAAAEYVDENGPTYDIDSYLNIATSPIPSLIFPWKPDVFDPNEFGRNTGIIHRADFVTSIRPSYLGDLFYNLGVMGLIIGPVFIALMLAFFRAACASRLIYFEPLAYALTIYSILDIENSLGNALGGGVKALIIVLIASFMARVVFGSSSGSERALSSR